MRALGEILQWVSASAYVLVGIAAAANWHRRRTRADAALAAAVGFLGLTAALVRVNALLGGSNPVARAFGMLFFVASAYALLEYRHTVVALSVRWRLAAAAALGGAATWAVVAGPAIVGAPRNNSARLAALTLALTWSVCVLEPVVRFLARSRHEPPVRRAHLRMVGTGCLGMILILVANAAATQSSRTGIRIGSQLAAIALAPVLFAAVASPASIRRRWLQSASRGVASELARIGTWYWDVQADLVEWSDELCEVLGVDRRASPPSFDTYLDLVHPDDRAEVDRHFQASFTSPTPLSFDHRCLRPDGVVAWIHMSGVVVTDPTTSRTVALYGTAQDITDRKQSEEVIRAGEQRLAETQAIARIGSWAFDVEADVFTWSEELDRLGGLPEFGLSVDPAAGGVLSLVHPDDRHLAAEMLGRLMEVGGSAEMELRLVRPDGEIRWIHARGEAVCDLAGAVVQIHGSAQDITPRKQAELLLASRVKQQEAVSRLSALALEGADVSELMDETTRLAAKTLGVELSSVFEVTARGRKLVLRRGIGFQADDIGRDVAHFDAQGKYDLVPLAPVISEDLGDDDRFAATWFLRQYGVVSSIAVPIQVGPRTFGALGAHSADRRRFGPDDVFFLQAAANVLALAIDARTRQRELQQSEEHFRLLVEAAPEAVLLIDDSGEILLANDEAARLLGAGRAALVGTDVSRFIAIDPGASLDIAGRSRAGATPRRRDLWARRTDGTPVPTEVSVAPLVADRGVLLIVSLRDLTDRRKAEQALRAAYDREREAADRLRAVDEMKDAFLEAVSHELRTPLTAVLGLSETLLRPEFGLTDSRSRRLAERVFFNAKRLDQLLADLLDLDRITRGVLEPRRRRVDVGDLVRRVAETIDVGDHPLTIDSPAISASIGTAQTERIIENLLINAVRHTPPNAPIHVAVASSDRGIEIVVDDGGPGIADEEKSAIFEPFRRGSGPAARAKGAGIGLTVVSRFAELQGGRAWVEDHAGGGASFHVFLPDGDGSDEDGAANGMPADENLGIEIHLRSPRPGEATQPAEKAPRASA